MFEVGEVAGTAEITLRCRAAPRLVAGFVGWEVERRGAVTVLRRAGATSSDVHEALTQVGELGLDLEAFRRVAG